VPPPHPNPTRKKATVSNKTKIRQPKRRFDPDDFEPVVVKASGAEVEEVTLFVIDETDDGGERTEYTIPKKVKFNVTLQATEILAQRGEHAAGVWMLRELLGEDGYEALINFDDLERDDFNQICEIAANVVLGPAEGRGKAR